MMSFFREFSSMDPPFSGQAPNCTVRDVKAREAMIGKAGAAGASQKVPAMVPVNGWGWLVDVGVDFLKLTNLSTLSCG